MDMGCAEGPAPPLHWLGSQALPPGRSGANVLWWGPTRRDPITVWLGGRRRQREGRGQGLRGLAPVQWRLGPPLDTLSAKGAGGGMPNFPSGRFRSQRKASRWRTHHGHGGLITRPLSCIPALGSTLGGLIDAKHL
ncbi:unnamed protein product [Arctogadus glacialis]